MNPIVLILNAFELGVFLIGVYFFKNLQKEYLKIFVVLLGFIFFSEMIGKYLKHIDAHSMNVIWYGFISLPIQFMTFFWLYSKRNSSRILFILPTVFYLSSLLIEVIILNGKEYMFSNLTYTVGNLLLLILIVNYLYRLLRSNDILYFKKDPFFWISLGQLIFYLPTIPFYFFMQYLYDSNINFYINYYYFATCLNCIMYVCYAISFVWKKAN